MSDRQHICVVCKREFKTEAAVMSHERWRHNLNCPLCDGGTGRACDWHFI